MIETRLGVVATREGWVIIGEGLRTRTYARRSDALRAVRKLGAYVTGLGLALRLDVQDEQFELRRWAVASCSDPLPEAH
jgi:hypothetical protein